ncbi:hypothetical protein D7X33_21665 [Butyricicoccus sp. 1XD8-22]|nr:hypothetical protein D7X33_21665 [Butyricicoccus sp. 1XD8-22]
MELLGQIAIVIACLLGTASLVFLGFTFASNLKPKRAKDYLKFFLNLLTVGVGISLVLYAQDIAVFLEPYFHLSMTIYYPFILIVMIVYIMAFIVIPTLLK